MRPILEVQLEQVIHGSGFEMNWQTWVVESISFSYIPIILLIWFVTLIIWCGYTTFIVHLILNSMFHSSIISTKSFKYFSGSISLKSMTSSSIIFASIKMAILFIFYLPKMLTGRFLVGGKGMSTSTLPSNHQNQDCGTNTNEKGDSNPNSCLE